MLVLLSLTSGFAGTGERIPFVKLRSDVWDVVIRKTADDRARIERVKAQCQGIWVNACAPGVDPELRQLALESVFQDGVALSGDFTYCSTAILRDLPQDLGRKLIRADTNGFCQIFLDPESVRGMRSGNATQGENDLVGRLMGGQNTTSGRVMIKAPPTMEGGQTGQVMEATGDRRRPGLATRPQPQAPPATAPTAPGTAMSQPTQTPVGSPTPTTPAQVAPVEPTGTDFPEHQAKGEFDDFVMPEPTFERPPRTDLFEGEDQEPAPAVFTPPEPEPAPEPMDPDLAELLAPIPQVESSGVLGDGMRSPASAPPPAPVPQPEPVFAPPPPEPKGPMASNMPPPQPRMDAARVAVPAPKPEPVRAPAPQPPPKPTGPSEFELEAMEAESLDRLSDRDEDDEKKGKKGKKGKKDEPEDTVGGDEEFDNYIIIDIESLSDE